MTEKFTMSLFDAPRGSHIVCTTDSEFSMKHGITKILNSVYDNLKTRLRKNYKDYFFNEEGPIAIPIDDIFVLVVKNEPREKATINNLKLALENLREWCIQEQIDRLYMPKLCCGYDGLDFADVENVIHEVFDSTDIIITICVKDTCCNYHNCDCADCTDCIECTDYNYDTDIDDYDNENNENYKSVDDLINNTTNTINTDLFKDDEFLKKINEIIRKSKIDNNFINKDNTDE